ncbi:YrdB family protein [Actinomadura macrotermitis]|uniref:DUF2568 domain-containing protein n=1 Tax=Actinomadura macrotermitis TaxID=2585200 RepID=A0A7K0C8Q9_9ACTN|nr:YrdB family protein [Actinomadura macrotermitis]MQY09861.1 hypothetical protein [Actinomadura macrotermitis]
MTILDLFWFAAELAVYASAVYWGLTRSTWPRRLGATGGGLALFIAIWGTFCAPQASHPLPGPAKAALETAWFLCGALAFVAARRSSRPAHGSAPSTR